MDDNRGKINQQRDADSLLLTLADWLEKQVDPLSSLVVAYSGGRDSHVLLHALWQLQAQQANFKLHALHINHGLQQAAVQWAQHCQQICQHYSIPLTVLALHLQIPAGESVENIARTQRYLAFAQHLQSGDRLLTAHTLDDQAETFLLQLLRGSGLVGLAGIAALKPLGKGWLARPLREVSRTWISAYASVHQLKWVEDHSNNDLRFRRNFLRQQIFPLLQATYPGVIPCIARSANHCLQAQSLLDEYLAAELAQQNIALSATLPLRALRGKSVHKQQCILRYWIHGNGLAAPGTKRLQQIVQQMLSAKKDVSPCVAWPRAEIRRYQDRLYLLPTQAKQKPFSLLDFVWPLNEALHLPDGSIWQAKLVKGQGMAVKKIGEEITVRFRQGGERCRLPGKTHSQSLKKLLQAYGVPPWLRASLPLFYCQQTLVGVANCWVCDGWQVTESQERGWAIEKLN